MKASKVDQDLTRPVALRRNSDGLASAEPRVASLMKWLPPFYLAVEELVALDAFLGVEVDDRGHQHPLLVGASGVDRKCLAELHRALALVDVAVEREHRLVLVDRFPDRLRANRPERPATVHQL